MIILNKAEEIRLMKVAYLYYNENYTQKEISNFFGVSKMTVSRMLQKARKNNIVEINVKMPYELNQNLQDYFVENFSLKKAIIARNIAEENNINLIGRVGAFNLQFLLRNNDVLGVGGSVTVSCLVDNIYENNQDYNNLKIVQLMGALEDNVRETNSFLITQRLSEKLGGKGYFFSAPAKVDQEKIKQMLFEGNTFQKIKELWDICNIAILGIGTMDREATLIKRNFISKNEQQKLKNKGAVGDLLGNFFDINGNIVNKEMQSQILSISQKKLFNVNRLITVAGGKNKAKAILGALRTEALDILITDETTALLVKKYKEGNYSS